MTIAEATRSIVGRRSRITRDDMAAILTAWAPVDLTDRSSIAGRRADGTLVLGGRSVETTDETGETARAWADACAGIVCISVYDPDTGDTGSPGAVRYDEPGSMSPAQYAHLAFVPQSAGRGTLTYLRGHASRVLVVREES